MRPPLPRPLPLPLNLVLGTAGALPISCDLPSVAVKLRVSRSAPGGGEGGFIGGEVEDEEEVEEEEGIAAGEGTVEAVEGIGIGV